MTEIDLKRQQMAALRETASRILKNASTEGRQLTSEEDSLVLGLMRRVQVLEEEIHRLRKYHAAP